MGAPTYDAETLAAYFHPIHPETWDDPIVGPVLRRLARDAPEVIAAVADVDRSLVVDALAWTPGVRLARALGMAAFIERTRGPWPVLLDDPTEGVLADLLEAEINLVVVGGLSCDAVVSDCTDVSLPTRTD